MTISFLLLLWDSYLYLMRCSALERGIGFDFCWGWFVDVRIFRI